MQISMRKLQKLILISPYFAKISWNQRFYKEITKELIWRRNFAVRVNFSFFHTVQRDFEKLSFSQNFFCKNSVKSTCILYYVHKNWFHEIFATWECLEQFLSSWIISVEKYRFEEVRKSSLTCKSNEISTIFFSKVTLYFVHHWVLKVIIISVYKHRNFHKSWRVLLLTKTFLRLMANKNELLALQTH